MSTVREERVRAEEARSIAPFFIVGCGRSGSTLLRLMLSSHSRLTIPPETWYLGPLLAQFGADRALSATEVERATSIITSHYRWPDMKMDAREFRREVSELSRPNLRDLVEVVYRRYMRIEGKVRWGDKTPVYIEILPALARMYPNSLFIHLVRDGRDVAKSFQATGWVSRWLHQNTGEWVRAQQCQRRWSASALRARILEVRYEDLVLEPEGTLREICRFIGEEFEPQMLSWEERVDEKVPPRERRYHTKLKLRIGPEGVGRWKREMTPRETFVSEAFMGAHLARLGYERRYRSALWAPAFALTRLYCRVVLPVFEVPIRAYTFLNERLGRRSG
jgi:hypothetical protein